MKLKCNCCNKQLTQDMYPVSYKHYDTKKVWEKITYTETVDFGDGVTEDYIETNRTFKKGVFVLKPVTKKYNWTVLDMYGYISKLEAKADHNVSKTDLSYNRTFGGSGKRFIVGKASVLDNIIPPFKSGYGCCNWSMGRKLTCSCGNTLGEMYLDCYEDGVVEFYVNKVDRVY
tara:strand:+ start:2400 stop:2918 length:519 start_codon:yes stop_codon:yes gene_type:complete